ncbi:helix-turn-helix transcriptional regulator [bacterium]|nr:helix-turn-helix transcriptional regulator [bacterium]
MQHANTKKSEIIFKTLSKLLREERLRQNKSQRLLAYEYDIQMSLISRLENGINEPKLISLWTICEALGIPLSELIRRVEQEIPKDFLLIEQ